MNQIIEKPNKNEWGLTEHNKSGQMPNWKESAEYKKTAAFVKSAYGPFGRVVFTGLAVIMLMALGIWGISFWAEALELIINSVRNVPNAGGVGAAIGSIAGALFAGAWKAAMGAIIIFPVWHGFKICYNKFLALLDGHHHAGQNSGDKS